MGNLSTPNSVQKLQMALHAKAKAEAGYRLYALYDKQCRDLAVAAAEHQVPFPVTRHCPILDGCRPLADRDGAHDPSVGVSLLRVMPRPTHAARAPQMLQQFFLQCATRLNEEAALDGLV